MAFITSLYVMAEGDWPPVVPRRLDRQLRNAIQSLPKDTTASSSAGLMRTMSITKVVVVQQLWAGVDAGKSDPHCVVIDAEGNRLLSRRAANDEAVLLKLIPALTALADGDEVTRTIDLNHCGAALLIILARRRLNVLWAMLRDGTAYQPAPTAAAA
jgi:hypothetical protein